MRRTLTTLALALACAACQQQKAPAPVVEKQPSAEQAAADRASERRTAMEAAQARGRAEADVDLNRQAAEEQARVADNSAR
jgi:hypothetical protein